MPTQPTANEIISLARLFLFVRELPQNRGQRVVAIQAWGGGTIGQSWCGYFATMILDIAYQGNAPIPRNGSCEAIRQLAIQQQWLRPSPRIGDLYLYLNAQGLAHHCGLVTSESPLAGISGNTSAADAPDSTNGDRVAEKPLSTSTVAAGKIIFLRYLPDPLPAPGL